MKVLKICAVVLCATAVPALAESSVSDTPKPELETLMQQCLLDAVTTADEGTTAGSIRQDCARQITADNSDTFAVGSVDGLTAVDKRMVEEDGAMQRDYILTAYKPSYILTTYSGSVNQQPFKDLLGENRPLNNEEIKFQISIKAPIFRKPFGWKSDLFFAYTATSWWQLGNNDISNPFRETNYEPEIFLRNTERFSLGGLKFMGWDLGFDHQSNGRSGDLSRSWNRIMARTVLDLNDVALRVRAWYRIPEDSEDDDNPREYRYLGYGDVRAVWVPSKNTYTLMYRPATEGGALEFTWSRKIARNWRIYAQYWNGYGESLLDYDWRMKRIGIGFALNDYLER